MKCRPTGFRWGLPACLFVFSLLLVLTACKKEPHQPLPAKGYFAKDKYGQCLPNIAHGLFYNGYPAGTDTNYVDVNVDVTSPGSYSIRTDKMNGVLFSAAGNFTDTGLQVVRLKASGSFISPLETIYPITFDSSTCSFYIQVQDSAGLSIADNTWQFTAQGHSYQGPCVGNLFQLPSDLGFSFEFTGTTASGSPDTTLEIYFYTKTGLDTTSYPTSDGSTFGFHSTGANATTYYSAGSNTLPAVIDIHFRSFTTRIEPDLYQSVWLATFDGTARDGANNIVPITNAKFKIVHN
jgi:hypothetical protein